MKMLSAATLVLPTGEMKKKIAVAVNENEKTRDRDVALIKEWLQKQPHLPNEWGQSIYCAEMFNKPKTFSALKNIDDDRLLNFLRGSNFSLEKCKNKLDLYFSMRTACPEFFTNRDVTSPQLSGALLKFQGAPLPTLTPEGRRVTICRGVDKDISTDMMTMVFKSTLMLGDVRLKEEVDGVSGDIYVLDVSIISPGHLSIISPPIIKKFLICAQEAYPVKLKEIHIVNTTSIIEILFNTVKPFLKEKIRNRIFFHSDIKGVYKYVPKEILPKEYGGNSGSLEEMHNAWIQKMTNYTKWFKEQEGVKAVEALRPGKPKNYDEIFGLNGSFRTLSLD